MAEAAATPSDSAAAAWAAMSTREQLPVSVEVSYPPWKTPVAAADAAEAAEVLPLAEQSVTDLLTNVARRAARKRKADGEPEDAPAGKKDSKDRLPFESDSVALVLADLKRVKGTADWKKIADHISNPILTERPLALIGGAIQQVPTDYSYGYSKSILELYHLYWDGQDSEVSKLDIAVYATYMAKVTMDAERAEKRAKVLVALSLALAGRR